MRALRESRKATLYAQMTSVTEAVIVSSLSKFPSDVNLNAISVAPPLIRCPLVRPQHTLFSPAMVVPFSQAFEGSW